MATLGAIAGGSRPAVNAGAAMLRRGGNAVDAIVAAGFATSAGDPAITSLLGGGMLTVTFAGERQAWVCDFFANAPGLGSRRGNTIEEVPGLPPVDFYPLTLQLDAAEQVFHIGRGTAAVPAALPGLCAVLERWGTLPLSQVVEPAVRDLRHGSPIGAQQAMFANVLREIIVGSKLGRDCFSDRAGESLATGAIFRNPKLADTLERLGREGVPRLMHDLAPRLIEAFGERVGGRLTAEDLASWRPQFGPAHEVTYAGARVSNAAAPSSGGRLIAHTLNLFDQAGAHSLPPGSPERLRRVAAAFSAIATVREQVLQVLDCGDAGARFAAQLARVLDTDGDASGSPAGHAGTPTRGPGNTTHTSVIDRDGNAASLTLSHGEGNGHALDDWGLFMNNFLGEEDLFPDGFHRFEPGRRLRTMMAPTIIRRGEEIFVLGSGGSNRIRTAIAQVIVGLLDDGLSPSAAVEHSRLHVEGGRLSAEVHDLVGGATDLELARRLAQTLEVFDTPSFFFGGVHVAYRDANGTFSGCGDARRGGEFLVVAE